MQLDAMLLAVVGILSELQDVANVPVWIAAGGFKPDITHTLTESMAEGGWAGVLQFDKGFKHLAVPQPAAISEPTADDLLAIPDVEMWYKSPIHVLYWVRRGLKALDERGIEPQHGLLVQSTSSW